MYVSLLALMMRALPEPHVPAETIDLSVLVNLVYLVNLTYKDALLKQPVNASQTLTALHH